MDLKVGDRVWHKGTGEEVPGEVIEVKEYQVKVRYYKEGMAPFESAHPAEVVNENLRMGPGAICMECLKEEVYTNDDYLCKSCRALI